MTETPKSKIAEESTSFSVSEEKCNKYTITWTIKDFDRCYRDAKLKSCMNSPAFPGRKGKKKTQWNIRLFPKDETDESDIGVYLAIVSFAHKEKVREAKYSFSILDSQKQKRNQMSSVKKFELSSPRNCGWKSFIKYEELRYENNLLPNGNLTLCCEIVEKPVVHVSAESVSTIPFKIPNNKLSLNLGDMFDSQKFGDVVFVANGQEINVYKGILSAHSPVFAAMFEHEMKENEENRVEVTEMDPKVLKETLRFVHTGETSKLDEMAEDLLAAADKYDLKRLKVLCEEFLFSKLSVETAAHFLLLSDRHDADQLKSRALDFICLHSAAIMDTEGWATLVKEQPRVINEAFRALALHKIGAD